MLLSICSLNSASVLRHPAYFLGMRPRLVFGVQEEVGPACKCKAVLGLMIPSSINEAVAAEQKMQIWFLQARKWLLGLNLNNLPRTECFLFPPV